MQLMFALTQRVLNDLQRVRLSGGRMIWLLAHPLPHRPLYHQQAGPATHRKTEKEKQFAAERGGEGVMISDALVLNRLFCINDRSVVHK
jgi:hypothetical protein